MEEEVDENKGGGEAKEEEKEEKEEEEEENEKKRTTVNMGGDDGDDGDEDDDAHDSGGTCISYSSQEWIEEALPGRSKTQRSLPGPKSCLLQHSHWARYSTVGRCPGANSTEPLLG